MGARLKPNVAVIGSHSLELELSKTKGLHEMQPHFFGSVPAALRAHKDKSFQAFLIEDGKASRISIDNLRRNAHEVAIVVVLDAAAKTTNSQHWESLDPLLLFDTKAPASAQTWILHEACQTSRKLARLRALRAHQNANIGLGGNPAIDLITRLIDECSRSTTYQEILRAATGLAKAIDFQECHLLVGNAGGNSLLLKASLNQKRENLRESRVDSQRIAKLAFAKQGATLITSGQEAHATVKHAFGTDCNSAILMRFDVRSDRAAKKSSEVAYLLFARTDLETFSEADCWLLEVAFGPIAISLEMIRTLALIRSFSKEWRATFDAISEPISVIDSNFRIQRANLAFAGVAGARVNSMIGRHCFTVLARKRRPCANCPTRDPAVPNPIIEARGKREFTASSFSVMEQRLRIQFYRDVSKERALAAALIQSEKMAGLGSLLSAIAHEINNPIAGILATSQLLKHSLAEVRGNAERLSDVEEIEQAARRSREIISNLLGFSSGYNREPIALQDAVASAVLFAKTALRHVEVIQNIPEGILISSEQISSLQQILFNLLTNAAHAIEKKGVIQIFAKADRGGVIELEVADSGKGISKEALPRVFEPFFSSKPTGKGTGLGLSIVRTLLSRMNGSISVESTPGKGSTFRFQFTNKLEPGNA